MTVDMELILKQFHIERYPQYNTLCVLPRKNRPNLLCYLISKRYPYCSHTADAWFHKIDTSEYDILIDYEEFDKYYNEREVKIVIKNNGE